jgi:nitrite reductase/ring-hydroxylating ferredoxin subunit
MEPYNGEMPSIKVATLSELPPDSVKEVLVGHQPYAICNVGGVVRALSGVCIHRGGPLGHGQIHEGRIVCPFHMWEFDCATGEYNYDPAKRLPTFEVSVEGEDVFLQVP